MVRTADSRERLVGTGSSEHHVQARELGFQSRDRQLARECERNDLKVKI